MAFVDSIIFYNNNQIKQFVFFDFEFSPNHYTSIDRIYFKCKIFQNDLEFEYLNFDLEKSDFLYFLTGLENVLYNNWYSTFLKNMDEDIEIIVTYIQLKQIVFFVKFQYECFEKSVEFQFNSNKEILSNLVIELKNMIYEFEKQKDDLSFKFEI
jgi:predicted AlkP superfamily phosphohydrolase/phosphomutase